MQSLTSFSTETIFDIFRQTTDMNNNFNNLFESIGKNCKSTKSKEKSIEQNPVKIPTDFYGKSLHQLNCQVDPISENYQTIPIMTSPAIQPTCERCMKQFANYSNLKHHIETIHLLKSQWKCTYCGKICTSKSNLKVHLRVHLRIKPYACKYCSYICMHHSSIRDHLNKQHGDIERTASEPGYVFDSAAVPEPDAFNEPPLLNVSPNQKKLRTNQSTLDTTIEILGKQKNNNNNNNPIHNNNNNNNNVQLESNSVSNLLFDINKGSVVDPHRLFQAIIQLKNDNLSKNEEQTPTSNLNLQLDPNNDHTQQQQQQQQHDIQHDINYIPPLNRNESINFKRPATNEANSMIQCSNSKRLKRESKTTSDYSMNHLLLSNSLTNMNDNDVEKQNEKIHHPPTTNNLRYLLCIALMLSSCNKPDSTNTSTINRHSRTNKRHVRSASESDTTDMILMKEMSNNNKTTTNITFKCGKCKIWFGNRSKYLHHRQDIHSSSDPYCYLDLQQLNTSNIND
ncbi:hypothetical protein SNEBB_004768 [Seison nebaliae]|nr:hypothetical protein SNEBB_004768 [Seison nebaliae]